MKQKMGRFNVGEVVMHFKHKMNKEYATSGKYLYRILAFAEHTETKEPMVVYQALYGAHDVYVRPYEMFASRVDKKKYPGIKAVYRFTRYSGDLTFM